MGYHFADAPGRVIDLPNRIAPFSHTVTYADQSDEVVHHTFTYHTGADSGPHRLHIVVDQRIFSPKNDAVIWSDNHPPIPVPRSVTLALIQMLTAAMR